MKLTMTHIVIAFLIIVGGAGAYIYNSKMEEKKKAEAIQAFIANQPVVQLVLKDHPAQALWITQHFTYHYEKNGGVAGMEASLTELQQVIDQNYAIDHVWYFDEMALRNYLVREYNFLMALNKKDPKGTVCTAYLKNPASFQAAAGLAGGDYFKLYMDSSAKLFKSAIPHKLYAIWPGVPGYQEELQKVMMKFIMSMIRSARNDPQLIATLQTPNMATRTCAVATIMTGSLVTMTPPEMSLLWRAMMESARPALVAERKKRGSE
jgi:hypothetical protein